VSPLQGEFPFLQKLHEELASKGLKIVALSIDSPEPRPRLVPFIAATATP